ncbi:MAG: hypothetical protein WCI73_11960 [Phycisphaerae bacterium]
MKRSPSASIPFAKTIAYNYGASGYRVQLCDRGAIQDEYVAGNALHDSTAHLPVGDPAALSLKQIKKLAAIEVNRLAAEYGVPSKNVAVDEDISL